jgi:hypothetical protein
MWRNRHMFPSAKSKTDADTFVDRVREIATDSEPADDVEIESLRDRHSNLNFSPLLIVGAIEKLCGRV